MGGRPPRVALFGVPGDNLNLGVRALMQSAVAQLHARLPDLDPWVFDDGLGVGPATMPLGDGELTYTRCGARLSKRVNLPESYANMAVAGYLRRPENPGVEALLGSDAVLDASAGDSFTDIYGPKRLRMVLAPKRLALRLRRPLVLLPQTYGPFREDKAMAAAAKVARRASMAWARDEESFALLRELVGADFDPEVHRQGVDMAFLLEPHRPPAPHAERFEAWAAAGEGPIVGINVSGLLYSEAYGEFGLSFDYRKAMKALVERFLADSDARIVFVDHVHGDLEPDDRATADLVGQLDEGQRARVTTLPDSLGPGEVKWVIARCDWFTGARMHATIAALSSGVPVAAVGYSMKTRAVFETCDVRGEVTEVSGLSEFDVVDQLWDSWTRRAEVRARLAERVPDVVAVAHDQMDRMAALVRASYGERKAWQ